MTRQFGIAMVCTALAATACDTGVELEPANEIAAASGRTFALAQDGDYLFWSGDAGVWRTSIHTGEISAVYADGPTLALSLTDDRVYWATADRVMTTRRTGGGVEVIAEDQRCVFAMAADERRVFWASVVAGEVWSWDTRTGERTLVASGQGNPTGMAIAEGRVYWSTGSGTIASAAVTGGDVQVLVDDGAWKSSIAVAGDDVVWIDWDATIGALSQVDGSVRRARAAGAVGSFAYALAADEGGVYWLRAADGPDREGLVLTAPAVGAAPYEIADANATALAIGREAVYWATDGGAIYARARQ